VDAGMQQRGLNMAKSMILVKTITRNEDGSITEWINREEKNNLLMKILVVV